MGKGTSYNKLANDKILDMNEAKLHLQLNLTAPQKG
jgi:hypothetical protein